MVGSKIGLTSALVLVAACADSTAPKSPEFPIVTDSLSYGLVATANPYSIASTHG